jgi:serine/threonine-protein kinase RsbW
MSDNSGPDVPQDLDLPQDLDVPQDLWVPPADQDRNGPEPCGYLTTSPDGTILRVNETFLDWTGYSRSALIGRRRFRDLLTSTGQIHHETHYAALLSMQDDVPEVAFDLICADGRRLPTLVNSVLGRDPSGLARVIRSTVFNATERRGHETELLAARRAVEASERRVRVLQQVVADLAAAPTEAEVAQTVVRAPGPAFGATDAIIWLIDPDRRQLTAVACAGPAVAGHDDVPCASSRPIAEVARRGDLHVIGSVAEAEEHFPELAATMRRTGRNTVVLLPLTAAPGGDGGPDALGVLAFGFAEARELTDSELGVVRLLGHQTGQALDRARLHEESRRCGDRAEFLAEITRALDEVHRLLPRARRLVERVVPEVAEWAAVRLAVGAAGLLADAGAPAPDPERLAERIAAVAATGEAQLTDDEGPDPDVAVLPLCARGQVLGTLALRMAPDRRTAAAEPVFLSALADRAGLALENARLYEQERAIARTLQRSLLTGDLPRDGRFAVETHYRAAGRDLEIGGDWFDAFLITGDKLGMVVGDVVGRGIDAASTMGQLRSAVRALASAETGPARLLERLDRFVDRVEPARMATVAYAEIDLATAELTYACAGHLPPLLAEPTGVPRYLLDGRSGALGSRAGRPERVEHRVRVAAGSRLLLFTDGLIQRRDRPIDRGFELLAREYARHRDAPLEGFTAGLADLLVGPDHADDVCLLCLALGTDGKLERTINADLMQIALLRRDLRDWLASHDVEQESSQAVLLAASEAAENAIEHGYRDNPFGTVQVTATISDDAIDVRVADHGVWVSIGADVPRGRGLQLIHEVMDEVTVAPGEGGTTVTMRRIRRAAR